MDRSESSTRRAFLRGSALAAAALPAPLARVRAAARHARPRSGRDAYTLEPGLCYLNHGSIGTMPRSVQEALCGYLHACERNPWLHMWGGAWEPARHAARAELAGYLGVGTADLALTRNTTEGCNVLARGLPLGEGDEVLFTSLNHTGASACFEHDARLRGYRVRRVELPLEDVSGWSEDDVVALHAGAIRDATRMLVLPQVDNLVGLRHPVAAIAAAARQRGVEFVLVDVAQSVGMLRIEALDALGADAVAGSPHKWLQAPKGTGFLWTTPALREQLEPLIVTWGQQRWSGDARVLEDYGTRALPNVLALGDAVAFQQALGSGTAEARRADLFARFRDAVDAEPGAEWASPRDFARGASLFAVRLPNHDASAVASRLFDEHAVVVRGFGAVGGRLRLSPNAANDPADVDRFLRALRAVIRSV